MAAPEPRRLFFANLPSDGGHLEIAVRSELREFRNFLATAKSYLKDETASRVGWIPERGGRDKGAPMWLELVPCPDRPNEQGTTFREFLSNDTEFVYECAPPSISNEKRERRTYFREEHKIKVLRRNQSRRQLLIERAPEFTELALKPNTYALDKQIEAIDRLRSEPSVAHIPLLRLLQHRMHADSLWPIVPKIVEPNWEVLTDATRDGTLEQRDFVRKALATPDFAFLEGPPGSGKTTAICELILQVVKLGFRVLLSASTHVAVDNVLERVADGRHNEIVAVRIDRRDADETPLCVQGLRLEKFVKSERVRLREFHRSNVQPTPAEEIFLNALESATDSEDMIERLILDSANLVAGTTIGILQHPDLKSARRSKHPEPPFDMLIVDEASKTTFQEFLVPALWAKRWVLVGDPRQLSPYADEDSLGPNIRALVCEKWKREACIAVDEASSGKNKRALMSVCNPAQIEFIRTQAEYVSPDLRIETLDNEVNENGITRALDLAVASVIIGGKQDFDRLESLIPLDFTNLYGDISNPWFRRLAAWQNHTNADPGDEKVWEAEIAWRLGRNYELRRLPKSEQPPYWGQIKKLLPYDDHEKVLEGIGTVSRLGLPSVLESLMNGVGERAGAKFVTALSHGLRKNQCASRDIYAERSQKLCFQHRMHPDISSTPRRLFYANEALRDSTGISMRRAWSCNCFGDFRSVWIDVNGKTDKNNRNEKEAEVLVRQLNHFLEWTKLVPHPGSEKRPWEVAILTFYRGQETLIREKLNRSGLTITGYGAYAHRAQDEDTATIKLCTVDRFQGHEADLVLLSFVQTGRVGFLASPNRLNVALTRARYQLVLIGSRGYFADVKRCNSSALNELSKLPVNTPNEQ
ncbi:MAG: AAA domain-containing protein [Planctomycetes bacterium]|nr:AAA domain-containing protein [Planctomycetota bacterium]